MIIFCIPCLVILVYFLIAAIFFPKYRGYVTKAWKCFIDKLRGKKCSISFDNRMRLALSMWFAKRGMVKLGKFFHSQRNFKIVFTILGIAFTIISIYLMIVLVQWAYVPPCVENACYIS